MNFALLISQHTVYIDVGIFVKKMTLANNIKFQLMSLLQPKLYCELFKAAGHHLIQFLLQLRDLPHQFSFFVCVYL